MKHWEENAMKHLTTLLAFFALAAGEKASHTTNVRRELKGSKQKRGEGGQITTLTLTIINESFNQPFGGFFVMTHNEHATPLYTRGQPASDALAGLAEDGNPAHLVEYYTTNDEGVGHVRAHADGAPFFGGATFQIEVEVSNAYPLVTIASMATNTNDCFVSLNAAHVYPGMVVDVPGLDAGTEENNELCSSIPGPACASVDTKNVRSGNGEGFVHVHRGFSGVGDLPSARYDWRNPMMRVEVD